MSSVNISITEDIYLLLSSRKAKNESFSEVLGKMLREKDARRCYGLLKKDAAPIKGMKDELELSRSAKWRDVR